MKTDVQRCLGLARGCTVSNFKTVEGRLQDPDSVRLKVHRTVQHVLDSAGFKLAAWKTQGLSQS